MFYLVRYAVQVGKKIEFHNSLYVHLSVASARREAESKSFMVNIPL